MVPLRPLGRVLTKVVFIVSGSVIRATLNAYRQSVGAGIGGAIAARPSPVMSETEAAKILGFDSVADVRLGQVREAHARLKGINSPDGAFQGSPYLVQRIDAASIVLSNYLRAGPGGRSNL